MLINKPFAPIFIWSFRYINKNRRTHYPKYARPAFYALCMVWKAITFVGKRKPFYLQTNTCLFSKKALIHMCKIGLMNTSEKTKMKVVLYTVQTYNDN
jgi:hypothetical protein